ncbi:hypothetical protein [Bacteroides caecimuris]|uniref:hypothetical protein n=1 Tax=Bacteroides caecimuris TaxID=1796613 RepID=UPI000EA38095|nr:hypothetical protein [Bacteroides caecimuris]NDO61841.1 hypothetical protein [Bacteroides caecimuris]
MNKKKICTGVVLVCVLFMSSCGSSAKLAKNHDEMKIDSRIWDYLNVSERERALVDSIVALDEYALFLDSFQKYLTKKNAMPEGEDVEQTKEFTEYAAACSKIFRIIDKLKLSKDASIAVFAKMREVVNNK